MPLRRAPTSSIDMCQLAVCGNHNLQLSYAELEAVSATAYFCVITTWTGAAEGVHQVSVTTRFDMCHSLAPEPKTNITDCLGII